MPITRDDFGRADDGSTIHRWTLHAGALRVAITEIGAAVVGVHAPDRDGALADVVLGFDDGGRYLHDNAPFFGVTVGRYGNRIADGRFTLDGVEHRVPRNDGGVHHLHGGPDGFHVQRWTVTPEDGPAPALRCTHRSPAGHAGFPGALDVTVVYRLDADGALQIDHHARSDASTIFNPTNHSYFNLGGHDAGRAGLDATTLRIAADRFLPTDRAAIPIGDPIAVDHTPFDFRRPAPLGQRLDTEDPQLAQAGGFDHSLVFARATDAATPLIEAHHAPSGRTLSVATTEPAVQLYTAGNLAGPVNGKQGAVYQRFGAFCLETQHLPDSPNRPGWPSVVLPADTPFHSRTVYRFGIADD